MDLPQVSQQRQWPLRTERSSVILSEAQLNSAVQVWLWGVKLELFFCFWDFKKLAFFDRDQQITPLKINMEHNHGGLEDHFPF